MSVTKAPSQGKIEQKFRIFPIKKSITLPVPHERTYEIKVNFPRDKIILSFFSFFPSKSVVNFRCAMGISERLKRVKLDEGITHSRRNKFVIFHNSIK